MIAYEVIERLRGDVAKLREPSTNPLRWLANARKWRWRSQVADDIEALIDLVTGAKTP